MGWRRQTPETAGTLPISSYTLFCHFFFKVDKTLATYLAGDVATHVKYEHDMMTSSNGNIFRVTGPLCGEFTGPGEFPTQRPVTRSFHVFFDLRPNKPLSKQSWGWWFETLSRSLWRHRNDSKGIDLHYEIKIIPNGGINERSCSKSHHHVAKHQSHTEG